MRNIKIVYSFLLGLCTVALYGQITPGPSPVATWTIVDPTVTGLKTAIAAGLVADNVENGLMLLELKKIKELEKDYADRRKLKFSDFRALAMMAVTVESMEKTNDITKELKVEIKKIKRGNLFFKHGIKNLESQLETEVKYLDAIRSDYKVLAANAVLGGGTGYSYTAFMKVLLRTMKIRRTVYKIQNKVNNLNTNNKIFKK